MIRAGIGLVLLVAVCTLQACGHSPLSDSRGVVRTIRISDVVKPTTVYARSGEEIRWENLRATPVRIGFLSGRLLEELGCKKGVSSFFGDIGDAITIEPGQAASLCPLRSGTLQFNVWFDADNPKGEISPTATIHVEAGG
ncbi:MAG TPA: hypothetical protein PKA61_07695 [Nitrospira sp.]|nr:hypothetical protein [Nitrospira sp.]